VRLRLWLRKQRYIVPQQQRLRLLTLTEKDACGQMLAGVDFLLQYRSITVSPYNIVKFLISFVSIEFVDFS